MGKYLDMLKAAEAQSEGPIFEKYLLSDPPKPPKPLESTFGGFGGWGGTPDLKIEASENPGPGIFIYPTCNGAPYLPYTVPVSPEALERIQLEFVSLIDELADIEAWPSAHRESVLHALCCQSLASLLTDLDYFRHRVEAARAVRRA